MAANGSAGIGTVQTVRAPVAQPATVAMTTPRAVAPGRRIAIALGVALMTAGWVRWESARLPGYRSDFDQILYAARAELHGADPYPLIGPGRSFDQPWPFYYPPASTVVALPFTRLSVLDARTAYAFCVAACLTFLLLREGYTRLPAVMSGAYLQAMSLLQWSPLVACGLLAPAWAWVVAAKPNAGLNVTAAAADRRSVRIYLAAAAAALALSFAFVPSWLGEWTRAIRAAPHIRPYIVRPGGALLLLALLRWRRPEARYLASLAVVPNSMGPADALVLFVFPQTFRQGLCLALLTHAAYFYAVARAPKGDMSGAVATASQAVLVLVLLPALATVLSRPNTGPPRPDSSD